MNIARRLTGQQSERFHALKATVRWTAITFVVVALSIQLVPYGRNHTNPPVVSEPPWDSPRTRQLAVQTCFACHSNQTVWPWYSNIAPLSWRLQNHVDKGRRKVNYSEWNRPQPEAGNSAKQLQSGEMPPQDYLWLHPKARLSPADRQALINGLTATFGAGGSGDHSQSAMMMRMVQVARQASPYAG